MAFNLIIEALFIWIAATCLSCTQTFLFMPGSNAFILPEKISVAAAVASSAETTNQTAI